MLRGASRFLVVGMATLLATGWLTSRPSPVLGAGSISLTTAGDAYVQDFNTLATANTNNTALPLGWDLAESGTSSRNNGGYGATHGTDASGDVFSFGPIANSERAYGTLYAANLTPTIGASFTNNTGATIVALDVAYIGEQWRLGALGSNGTPPRGADRLDFQYSLDATSLTTGTWVNADSLDFVSPITGPTVGALNGNLAANRTAVGATIGGLSIADGSGIWIRWAEVDVGSSDDGLGVDDFSVTPFVDDTEDEAPTIEVAAGISCATAAGGGSFALVAGDKEMAAADLTVSLIDNTNTTLVPNGNVVFGGRGANRTVAIATVGGEAGSASLTIGVGDGVQTATTTITVWDGGAGSDVADGTSGADLIIGGKGDDTLWGAGGADVLCGGQGGDTLAGGGGDDALDGGQGGDSLSGGNGEDRLDGGQGGDTLEGGAGPDRFSGGPGGDTNTDFTSADGDTSDGT